jgi:hypothetical protein
MSVEALAVFLVCRDGRTGTVELTLHNALGRNSDGSLKTKYTTSLIGNTNLTFNYVPFIYQGGTLNRNGDNITAGLGMAPNEISMAYAVEMTETIDPNDAERIPYTVQAVTMRMNPTTYEPVSIITDETWIAAAFSYTADTLEIVLSSAIDAVNALAPNYSLNRVNVGQIPVTGNLRV